MANNYTEIMKIVNQGNKMGLSNTITRDNGIPLDLSSVQESYEAAVIYAATKAIAYVGQPLAVGAKLYIISDTAAEEKYTAADGTEYNNYLVEVGSKTEGDGLTIDLVDGVLMLHGIDLETTTAGMLPQVEVIDGKKQIKWVTVSQIVQGDGNKVTTLTSSDGSVVIEATTDTDASLVYDLKVAHPDIPEYAVAAEERAEGATTTTYHLTKDGEYVDVAIVVPDAYNDTALAGRVKAVEDNKANANDVYTKGEVDTAIDNAVKGILGEGIDEAYNTLKEIQDILEGTNGETIDGLIETVDANKQAIAILNGDATTAGSVAKAVADAEARVENTYATKQDLTDHSNTMDGKLAEYAKTADVNTELAKKIENATIAHTSEGIAEGVTKDGTTLKIVVDAYTKEETLTKIQEKVTEINGGESAGEVLGQLNSYIETNDAVVAAINSTIGTPGEGQNDEGDTIYSLVAEAQTQANKGVDDAKTANDAIAALTNGAVATNTTDIATIKGRLDTLETAKGNHETRIAGVEGRVSALEAEDVTINEVLGTVQGNITALQGEDGRLAGLIAANTTEIGKKAAQTDVDAINAKIGTVAENTTLIAMIGAKADQATTYTKTEVDNLLKNLDQTEINNAIAANTAAIAALAGEGNTSTVKKNADDIAALDATLKAALENNGEGLDSIKELAVWIQEHETEVLPVINAHTAILAGIGGEGEKATVVEYVADAIIANAYELPAATAEILGGVKSAADVDGKVVANAVYVDATTNIGNVKAVSTDVLVNGAQELVLNGGSAKA